MNSNKTEPKRSMQNLSDKWGDHVIDFNDSGFSEWEKLFTCDDFGEFSSPEHNFSPKTVDPNVRTEIAFQDFVKTSPKLSKSSEEGNTLSDPDSVSYEPNRISYCKSLSKQTAVNIAQTTCHNIEVLKRGDIYPFTHTQLLKTQDSESSQNISDQWRGKLLSGNKDSQYSVQEAVSVQKGCIQEKLARNQIGILNPSSRSQINIRQDFAQCESSISSSQESIQSESTMPFSQESSRSESTIHFSQKSARNESMLASSQESFRCPTITVSNQESFLSHTMISSQGSSRSQTMTISSQGSSQSHTMIVSSQESSRSQTMTISSQGSSQNHTMIASSQEVPSSQDMVVTNEGTSENQSMIYPSQVSLENQAMTNLNPEDSDCQAMILSSQGSSGSQAMIISSQEQCDKIESFCNKVSNFKRSTFSKDDTSIELHNFLQLRSAKKITLKKSATSSVNGTFQGKGFCKKCIKVNKNRILSVRRKELMIAKRENAVKIREQQLAAREIDIQKREKVLKRQYLSTGGKYLPAPKKISVIRKNSTSHSDQY